MTNLEDIFEHTTDAVFGTDKHMRIRYWNNFCEKLFDIDKEQALGKTCHELICGRDLLGNSFCGTDCKITKHHDKDSPNRNWDLVIKKSDGEQTLVNVGSYYNDACGDDDSCIRVLHCMRPVNSHQMIRRLLFISGTPTHESNNLSRLSKREYEILQLVSTGTKAKSIAELLAISQTTVRNHIKNIYSKLDVHSQAEAINYAMRHGLL